MDVTTETKMGMTLTPWALEPLSHRRAVATELAELPGAAYATNNLLSRKASIAIARADIAKLSAA